MSATMRQVVGFDVGGANLKAAHSNGAARPVPFALWKQPGELADRLRELLQAMPPAEFLALTMTGELCDCFASRTEGVAFILGAVTAVAEKRPVHVWSTRGRFVTLDEARTAPQEIASANWLALAVFARRYIRKPGLLIDIGSTTTDSVPFWEDRPQPSGRTDAERLHGGELVYTGWRRTPLCAILPAPAMAEFFATALDAYLMLGLVPENADDRDTADGRPATRACARVRLARMYGADDFDDERSRKIAEQVRDSQITLIQTGLRKVLERMPEKAEVVLLAGAGEYLARLALQQFSALASVRILSLNEELGPAISQAACAYAVARLAAEASSC
jgi:probable H4MPT-linked C1 transfer pathway protein